MPLEVLGAGQCAQHSLGGCVRLSKSCAFHFRLVRGGNFEALYEQGLWIGLLFLYCGAVQLRFSCRIERGGFGRLEAGMRTRFRQRPSASLSRDPLRRESIPASVG